MHPADASLSSQILYQKQGIVLAMHQMVVSHHLVCRHSVSSHSAIAVYLFCKQGLFVRRSKCTGTQVQHLFLQFQSPLVIIIHIYCQYMKKFHQLFFPAPSVRAVDVCLFTFHSVLYIGSSFSAKSTSPFIRTVCPSIHLSLSFTFLSLFSKFLSHRDNETD